MARLFSSFLLLALFGGLVSCDLLSSSDQSDVDNDEEIELEWPAELDRLEFFVVDDTLTVQESILIRGVLPGEYVATDYEDPLQITLTSDSSENTYQAGLTSWDFLSDETMHNALHYGIGERLAMIGSKQEDEDIGITRCEDGQEALFDEDLADEVAEWVKEKENISAWRSDLAVYLSFNVEDYPNLGQVETIREHPNVWFLKPVTGAFFKDGSQTGPGSSAEDNCNELRRDVAAVLDFEDVTQELSLEPGDRLTVRYTQPNGDVIEDTVVIWEES